MLINREHSRLSSQVKTLEKVLHAPFSDKEHQRLVQLAANWRSLLAFDDGAGVTPCHGELILAFDPLALGGGDADAQTARAEHLLNAISDQARLPSQRRFTARERSQAEGIAVPAAMYQDILQLAD
mgnify:CR=1 FL=1